MSFSRLRSRVVHADFLGGRLTTDAGVRLLRQTAQRIGLFDAWDRVNPDSRLPEMIRRDQKTLLAQRITAIALRSEDLNDHQTLRADPALQLAAGKLPDGTASLASPPTLAAPTRGSW